MAGSHDMWGPDQWAPPWPQALCQGAEVSRGEGPALAVLHPPPAVWCLRPVPRRCALGRACPGLPGDRSVLSRQGVHRSPEESPEALH